MKHTAEALPAELPVLEVRAEQRDTLFRLMNNELLHMEFQMTLTDLRRFYRYQFEAGEAYNTRVHTVVFYGPGITSAPEVLDRGSGVSTVHTVFIGALNGDDGLDALREKLRRGQALDELDQTRFKLLLCPVGVYESRQELLILACIDRIRTRGPVVDDALVEMHKLLLERFLIGGDEGFGVIDPFTLLMEMHQDWCTLAERAIAG